MFIKSIFKELFKKKLSTMLMLIQIVITIVILVYSYDNIRMLNYPRKQMESILGDNYKDIYQIKVKNSSDSKEFQKSFNEFSSKLKEVSDGNDVGGFHLTNTQFEELENNPEFMDVRSKFTKGTFKELHPESIELYRVDYSIYKLMNIKIENGRDLNEEDLNEEDFTDRSDYIIPMIISNNYKDVVKINDILTSRLDNRKYKVVGFFNEKIKWLYNSDPVTNELVSLNDKVITPYFVENSGLDTVIKSQSYYFINNNKISNSTLKNDINTLGKQFNLNVEFSSLEDQISDLNNTNKESIFYSMLISIFFAIVSCSGLSIIMYYSINLRKSELGIRMICGGSINYVKSLVVGEITVIMLVAFGISSVVLSNLRAKISTSSNLITLFDTKTSIVVFIALFIFTIISSILPLNKISKLSPKDLIGGTE